MKTTLLPEKPDASSPAGAHIRFLMDGATGNMIHSTVPPHQTNRATVHATVSEFWFILEGHGEASVEERVIPLKKGTALTVPAGKTHGYRNPGSGDLLLITLNIY